TLDYSRLRGYWYPLIADPKKNAHNFNPTATFDMAFGMYCFDRELRKLVLAELEKIEVTIRSKMINVLSHHNGSFWYNQSNLFNNSQKHIDTLAKLRDEFNRSDEQFLKSFKRKYSNPLPPSWMLLEMASVGQLSRLYKNLKPRRAKRDIANYFGLDTATFESWLHSFVYVRNVCAHHARLWNRTIRILPVIPTNPSNTWLIRTHAISSTSSDPAQLNKRTYYILSMIIYFLDVINPNHTFKTKVMDLLIKYPNIDTDAI